MYKDLYDFSKIKIDSELGVILKYYYANIAKFNVKSVDLMDDALKYQERLEKLQQIKKSSDHEHAQLVEEIIVSIEKNKRNKIMSEEEFMSVTEKQVRDIIDKFRIKVNRQ
mgnify:CR=1 FL=1